MDGATSHNSPSLAVPCRAQFSPNTVHPAHGEMRQQQADEDPDRLSFSYAVRLVRRKLPQFAALSSSSQVLNEILEECVASSRGRRVPRGVKRKISGYSLRPRRQSACQRLRGQPRHAAPALAEDRRPRRRMEDQASAASAQRLPRPGHPAPRPRKPAAPGHLNCGAALPRPSPLTATPRIAIRTPEPAPRAGQ